jgi:hypothetical protein
MNIYLAARYSRREELCRYRESLRSLGYRVTSRWLDGGHELDERGLSTEAGAVERARFAREDYLDVSCADILISFTEMPRSGNGRGGRHVEFGIALARGMRVLVVGPRENVFHCLPEVEVFPDWAACEQMLASEARAGRPARPNAETRKALQDADAGRNLTRHGSLAELFEDCEDREDTPDADN